MRVEVGATYTRILEAGDQELAAVKEIARFQRAGVEHTDVFKKGVWDGYTDLLWWRKGGYIFPTGLLPLIEAEVECEKIESASSTSNRCVRAPRP